MLQTLHSTHTDNVHFDFFLFGYNYSLIFLFIQAFLKNLISQQFRDLHPFSSYQRRHMALSILQLLSTIFPNSAASESHIPSSVEGCSSNDTDISPVFEFPRAVSVEQARRLVYSLRDSYDANRALVLELLCCMSQDSLGLQVN